MALPFPVEEVLEGRARLLVPRIPRRGGPGTKGPWPFYNPTMVVSRDVSALALLKWPVPLRVVLDGLAATGAWGIRMVLEAGVGEMLFNDQLASACNLVRENLHRNGIVANVRCARFGAVLDDRPFDFVDIDPFGPPVRFLEDAFRVPAVPAGLGVTATDTAVLSGTYPDACQRRYGAQSLRCPQGHEIGLRLMLGFCARLAARAGHAVRPLLAFSAEHFLRVFLLVEPLRRPPPLGHVQWLGPGVFLPTEAEAERSVGPLWLGPIVDGPFVRGLTASEWTGHAAAVLLDRLQREEGMPPFFYTTDELAAHERSNAPRMERLLDAFRESGFRATRTHFHPRGFKTEAPANEVARVFREAAASGPTGG